MIDNIIEKEWLEERVPFVNGIIYPSGRVVMVDIGHGDGDHYDFIKESCNNSNLEEIKAKGDFDWVNICGTFRRDSENRELKVVCGEASWGSDGFVSLYSNVEKRLLWIAFFDNSNPFVEAEIDGSMVIARTNLDYLWSFPIDSPEDFVIEKARLKKYGNISLSAE